MIKKFEEFVNELFAKSVNRGLSGGKRLENTIWAEESMFEVNDFKDYYISPDPEGFFIEVYHYPNEEKLLSFEDLDLSGEYYLISPFSTTDYESDKMTPEESKLIKSSRFKRAVNETIRTCVPDDYFAIY